MNRFLSNAARHQASELLDGNKNASNEMFLAYKTKMGKRNGG